MSRHGTEILNSVAELDLEYLRELVKRWGGIQLAEQLRKIVTAETERRQHEPRYRRVWCSQCGGQFGPANSGYSHCENHEVVHGV